jgi:PAS domain S-box-containing protein
MECVTDYALVLLDPRGRVAAWNPGAERTLGYQATEVVGRHFALFFTPEDVARGQPQEELRAAAAAGRVGDDRWFVRKDGTRLWCGGTLTALRHNCGTLRGFAKVLRDQTERRLREEALQKANERFRLAAAAVKGVIYNADLTTDIVLRSEGLFAVVGYHPDEAAPTEAWWKERIHPDDLAGCLVPTFQTLTDPSQGQYEVEYRVRHKDGHYVHVWDHAIIFRDGQGRPARLVGSTFDITARKLAEEALRESEDRHRVISELTSDYNYALSVGPDGASRLEVLTEGFTRITGYTLEEVNARGGWATLIHPEDMPAARQGVGRVLTGQVNASVVRLITRDGSIRWVSNLNKPVWDAAQARVVRIIGAAQDITERIQVEQALREGEARFQAFMDNGPAVAWMKDDQFRFVYVNKPHEQRFRKTLADCRGLTDFDIWPEVAVRLRENDRAVLASGEVTEFSERVPDPDGSLKHWLVYKFPFTDASGKRFVGGMAIDITDRRRAEEEVRESRERLQALSRQLIAAQEGERRRLAHELHDEIGQTLTAISINLHAVTAGADGAAQTRLAESIAIVDRAIEQVRHLSLDLRPSLLDDLGLEAALRWCADRHIRRSGLDVRLDTDLGGRRLLAELETTCFRVAQEALTNVARHARARRVWVELQHRGTALELAIRDDGIGFDPGAARRRCAEGASFGLLGMQERVELLGGEFAVESRPGQGTSVRARFSVVTGRGEDWP